MTLNDESHHGGEEQTISIPRLLISGDHGSVGKTTFTTGLLSALQEDGVEVQPFKKGPDFIDPMWLSRASGRICHNLDFYMMEEQILPTFRKGIEGAELSIIEGNQGLFDGLDTLGTNSSSALARVLGAPVLLVVNTRKMTRGIAPLLLGYQGFEKDIRIAGVVLNNVAGDRHEKKLRDAIEYYTDLEVLGAIHRNREIEVEERHLGLTTTGDSPGADRVIRKLSSLVRSSVSLRRVLELASMAPPLRLPPLKRETVRERRVRIGVAQDRAFSFYYPENLEALEREGAELCYFSPVAGDRLPDVEALYLGGGFPETSLRDLEANEGLRREIRERGEAGMPLYAECGGLMYLSGSILHEGEQGEMVGLLPFHVEMTARPQGRGYMVLEREGNTLSSGERGWPLPPDGEIRAHEFHHSRVVGLPESSSFLYNVKRGNGIDGKHDGFLYKNVLASYVHLHAHAAPWWAPTFVEMAERYKAQNASGRIPPPARA